MGNFNCCCADSGSSYLSLPETSPTTILYQRTRRLEKLNGEIKTMTEIIKQQPKSHKASRSTQSCANPSLYLRTITFLDPAILFLNCYTFLTYGIRYSFLEAFPIVYQGMYGFNLGEMGAAFLVIVVGTIIFIIYNIYLQNQRPKNQIPKSSHQARNHTNPHAIRLPPPSSLHRPIPIRLDRTPRNLPDRAGNRNRHLPRLRAYSDAMCFCTCRDVIRSMRRMCSRRRTLREVR